MRRTRALLWTLAILEQGESLGAIKRLDPRAPIWPKNAGYLQSRGCLESVTITSRLNVSGRNTTVTEGDKILRIPRLVRDYGPHDHDHTGNVRRSYATSLSCTSRTTGADRNCPHAPPAGNWQPRFSTYQSGNELALLKCLLQSPDVYFSMNSIAFQLALSYVSQLKAKGFFGEAYEAAKDTLAIVGSMHGVYDKEEVYHIQLSAASCAPHGLANGEACVQISPNRPCLPSVGRV